MKLNKLVKNPVACQLISITATSYMHKRVWLNTEVKKKIHWWFSGKVFKNVHKLETLSLPARQGFVCVDCLSWTLSAPEHNLLWRCEKWSTSMTVKPKVKPEVSSLSPNPASYFRNTWWKGLIGRTSDSFFNVTAFTLLLLSQSDF